MSNIVFSFDAQAFGVLTAIDAMIDGFGRLESAVEGMVSSFGQINSQIETMQSSWTALFQNFDSLQGTLGDLQQGMSGASGAASNLGYELEQLAMRAQKAAEAHAEAVARIEREESDLTEKTQEEIDRRAQSYQESLDRMVEKHQYAIQEIQQQEDDLSSSYLEQIDKRLVAMQNPQAVQHKYLTESLEEQIAALASIGQGNGAQAQSLEAELTQENTKYQQFLTTTIEPFYQYIDTQGYQKHQQELQRLQDRLTQENTMYAQQRADLQNNYQQQLADLQAHYHDEEAALAQHLTDENTSYAEQMRELALERQHALTSGGGRGGGVGLDSTALSFPPNAGYIQLFKQLGIDPSKDPDAAKQALMTWMMGGSFRGQSFKGQYLDSQLTLQQLFGFVTSNLEQGQDPTRPLVGGRDYLAIMSDLVALTGANRLNMSADQRQTQIAYAMDQILSGNTGRGLLSLEKLGMSKKFLMAAGLKFDKGGKVTNPQDAYMAVLKATELVAPGLGSTQAFGTVAGVMNEFRDIWNRISIDIGGSGVWARFREDLTKVFWVIYNNIPAIEKFGEGISNWVLGKFEQFFAYMQGSQGQAILHEIGNGFREIGNALQWIGQHKDIVLLLMGLLTAQMGSKILGGLTLKPLQNLMGGGLFGGVGSLFAKGAPDAAAVKAFEATMASRTGLLGLFNKAQKDEEFAGDFAMRGRYLAHLSGLKSWEKFADAAEGTAEHATFKRNVLGDMVGALGPDPLPPAATASMFDKALAFLKGVPAWAQGITHGTLGAIKAIPGVVRAAPGAIMNGLQTANSFAGLAIKGGGGLIGQGISAVKGFGGTIMGAFGAGGGGLGGIGSVLSMIGGGIGPLLAGLGPALAGIAAAAGPILLVAAAIAGLIFVLVSNKDKIMPFINTLIHFFGGQLKQAEKAIMDFVHQVQERLGPAFGPGSGVFKALQFFSHFWTGAWGGIQLTFKGVWDIIVGIIKVVWSLVSGIILIGLDLLGGKWGLAWHDLGKMLGGVWDGIKQILGGALKGLVGLVVGFFGGLWGFVSGKANDFSQSFIDFFTGLPKKISGVFTGIGDSIAGLFGWHPSHKGPAKAQGKGIAASAHAEGFVSPEMVAGIGKAFGKIGDALQGPKKAIGDFLGDMKSRFGDAFGPSSPIGHGIAFVAGLIGTGIHKIEEIFKAVWPKIQAGIKVAWAIIGGIIHVAWNLIWGIISGGVGILIKFWQGAWNGIKMVFSGIWDVIKGVIHVVWAIISGVILTALDLISGKWGKAWDDIKKMFKGVWDGIVDVLKGVFKIIWGAISGFFGGLWNIVATPLNNFWNSLTSFFGKIPAIFTTAFSGIGKALTTALQGIGSFEKSAFDWLSDHAGIFKGAVQGLGKMLHVPGYAEGGAYPGNQLALVGERGPELFFSGNKGSVVSNQQIRDAVLGNTGRGRGQGHMAFYGSTFNLPNVSNAHQFYQELNRVAGKRAEHGIRGGNAS